MTAAAMAGLAGHLPGVLCPLWIAAICLLQTTSPRLPARLPSGWLQPRGVNEDKSEGWRKRNARLFPSILLWAGQGLQQRSSVGGQPRLLGPSSTRSPRVRVLITFPSQIWGANSLLLLLSGIGFSALSTSQ